MNQNKTESLPVKVLHAGSLTSLVRGGLGPALSDAYGIEVESEPGHSVALALAIRDGRLHGDLYLSAAAEVNQLLLEPANGECIGWFVVFARNTAVLAYSPNSRFLADFERARSGDIPWYQVLLQPGVQIRRNDPHLDPMGYYTLLVCMLAERYYGIPDLKWSAGTSSVSSARTRWPAGSLRRSLFFCRARAMAPPERTWRVKERSLASLIHRLLCSRKGCG